ncbi:MAG: ankyrin repeat domain-containing protein [Tannerellaceae bacterium]|nr:ankyrin repeat domain-containing protein [Tannerellaceae bacterium]
MQNIFFRFWMYGLFLVCCPAIRGTNSGVFVQAVMQNRLHQVQELVEQGANVNYRSNYDEFLIKDMTVLDCAVQSGDTLILELLRKKGANLQAVNREGLNSFYYAVYLGNIPCMQYFINQGVKLVHESSILSYVLSQETPMVTGNRSIVMRNHQKRQVAYLAKVKEEIEKERAGEELSVIVPDSGHEIVIPAGKETDYKTYYRKNVLVNRGIVILVSILYLVVLLLLFIRDPGVKKEAFSLVVVLLSFSPLVYLSVRSVIFNTNELIVRYTGTGEQAMVTWETEVKKRYGRADRGNRYYVVYHSTFYYSPADSVNYEMEGGNTTFDPGNKDRDVNEVMIRVNKKENKMAVVLPWHTRSNIIWLSANLIILTGIMVFIGRCFGPGRR